MRTGIDLLRRLVGYALAALIVVALFRFALTFQHPAAWDAVAPIAKLRAFADAGMHRIAVWLNARPFESHAYFPLAIGVALIVLRAIVNNGLLRLIAALTPARAPAPAAAPAPAPVATVSAAAPPEPGSNDLAETVVLPATPKRQRKAAAVIAAGGRPQIGRYVVLDEIGRGGMGAVYKATDPQIGRTVAIKTILASHLSPENAALYKQRFVVEAQSAGRLNHPGIVTIHDIAEDDAGQPCLVMEWVDGVTLEKAAGTGGLHTKRIIDIVTQVAEALDYAHAQGIVHRDIKPANILLTREGRAKITDFGIAKMDGTQLTATGQAVGTPGFMSPEQFLGKPVDRRSDVFSLGSLLYSLCAGELPFPGPTVTAVAYKVVHTDPVLPRTLNPTLPAEIDEIVQRCLAKDPDARYQTAGALAADMAKLRKSIEAPSPAGAEAQLF